MQLPTARTYRKYNAAAFPNNVPDPREIPVQILRNGSASTDRKIGHEHPHTFRSDSRTSYP